MSSKDLFMPEAPPLPATSEDPTLMRYKNTDLGLDDVIGEAVMSDIMFPAVPLVRCPVGRPVLAQNHMEAAAAVPPVLAQIHMEAPSDSSSLANLLVEALDNGAVLVDVRPPDSSEAIDGVFRALLGAVSAPLQDGVVPLTALPADKETVLIVHCRSGRRAGATAAHLVDAGYSHVYNAGGPAGDAHLWQALAKRQGEVIIPMPGGVLQLFDGDAPSGGGSSTLTYILTDLESKEAIIIDPVLEQVERDLAAIQQAGCTLVLALNTHAHADHITGSGLLKAKLGNDKIPIRSAISRASGASADILLEDGEEVTWANGKRRLRVLATPGHTAGCVCYYDPTMQVVFTGDVLLIGGCGRTDFQGGSAETLYESVHTRLFTMPDTTLVYPAHDYRGRRYSTIGTEKTTNPRLTKSKSEFVELMAGLNLPYPKKIDAALPANMRCGVQD